MTTPIDPITGLPVERRGRERRSDERRQSDRRKPKAASLPAVIKAPAAAAPEPAAQAAFAAQLIGQGGHKRGLRGGPPVLEKARVTYLETEWTGPSDRRKPAGRIAKTEI
jgi:hypothetical protein